MAKKTTKPVKTFWRLIIHAPGKTEQQILFIFIDSSDHGLFERWPTDQAIDILNQVNGVKLERCMMWRSERPEFGNGVYRCSIHAAMDKTFLILREQEQTAYFPCGNMDKPGQILGRIVPMIINRCNL